MTNIPLHKAAMCKTVIFLVTLLEPIGAWTNTFSSRQMENKLEIFPWVGVLKVKQGKAIGLARLILIGERTAISNANEISRLDKRTLRKSSIAIFHEENKPWKCNVTDYLIHPEIRNKSYNTIAIVYLDCKREKWHPIDLPRNIINQTNTYAIGLTDHRSIELEQSMLSMMPVNKTACKKFYKTEALDFKYFWPHHFLCYKAVDIGRTCVFDSGMALAVEHNGNWTLAGIGILGPGCSLPSRYIQLHPYMPWIVSHIGPPFQSNLRRQNKPVIIKRTKTAISPESDIVSDYHKEGDDFYIDKLDDSTMAMRPGNANIRETVHGDCLNNEGIMMYRDAGLIKSDGRYGRGVYALSLYDLFYFKITCVMVSVRCKKRSITKFWYEQGFGKDDLSPFIKVVPYPKNPWAETPPKILFITDYYHNYSNITTANILFKFEFEYEATINVDFYGTLATTSTTSTTTASPTPTTTRQRRTYWHHLYSTKEYMIG